MARSAPVPLREKPLARPLLQCLEDFPTLLRTSNAHKPEGAFFLWLWLPDLPISSQELYQRLKAHGVLVVPGHHCFFGLNEDWPHRHECIRISYVQEEQAVQTGMKKIAEVIREVWSG